MSKRLRSPYLKNGSGETQRHCPNLADAVYGQVFVKADKLRSRAGQNAPVASRHQITPGTVKHMLREWRLRFKTEHLSAHWFDNDFRKRRSCRLNKRSPRSG